LSFINVYILNSYIFLVVIVCYHPPLGSDIYILSYLVLHSSKGKHVVWTCIEIQFAFWSIYYYSNRYN